MTGRFQFSLRALLVGIFGLVTLAAIGAIAICGHGLGFWWRPSRQRAFDTKAWEQSTQPNETVRSEMLADLLERFAFRGWHRSEIVGLLGEPDGTSRDIGVPGDVAYFIGLEPGGSFALDYQYLWFKFEDSKVAAYGVAVN